MYQANITFQPGSGPMKAEQEMMRAARHRTYGALGIPFPKSQVILRLFATAAWLFFGTEAGFSQVPPFAWVRSAGGTGSDMAYGIAVDSMTNIYVTGSFQGTAFFGVASLTNSSGGGDIFVAKFNDSGTLLWIRKGGATSYSAGRAIATDASGNVYVTGNFQGTANFDGINLSAAGSSGSDDIFVAKYTANGNVLWAKRAGGTGYDEGYGVAIDADGNCHVVGQFSYTATFGATNIESAGQSDAFHASYDPTGNLLWVKKAGGLGYDRALGIGADSSGNTYVVGRFQGPAVFGGIPLSGFGVGGSDDVFATKYDGAGNVLWARQAGGTSGDSANGVAVDSSGNCYITGNFGDIANFGGINLTSAGSWDIFAAKYDSAGNVQWARRAGSSDGLDQGNAVSVDAAGNCFVTGFFRGTASFGNSNLVSSGGNEIFVAKYDTAGTLVWAKKAGLVFDDSGNGIALDNSGNIYVAGSFYDSANFDSTYIQGAGGDEIFIAKLPAIAPVPPTITTQPQSQMVLQASNASFNIVAGGSAPLSYQWRFNGTNLPSQTNVTLTITNAQLVNEGPYRVVVSNAGGSVTSIVATLTIVFPPSIASQPLSQIVTAGTDVTFGITTTGTLPLSYRWQFNGANIATGTNAVLVISNAQPVSGGNYMVIVTNAYGAVTSSVATLTVRYSLTVNVTGGGTVTRNPSFTNYPPNLTITLTATPSAGFIFNFWSGDASGNANPLNVTMTTNKTLTANFASTAITIGIQGEGTVSKAPDKPFYNVAEQVTLTAAPARWFGFIRWSDGPTLNPRVISIGVSNTYTAIFSPTTAVETLTFSNVSRTAPVGMPAVFVDGEFVVAGTVTRLDTAELSMLTTFPNGSIFYTLDGSAPDFGTGLYEEPFVLHRSATVRAVAYDASFLKAWEADPMTVIIEPTFVVNASTPGGGTVGVSPEGASYRSNTLVTLTATPAPGWTFLQWLGDASGTSAITSVRVLNRDLCAQALFGTTLGITVAGSGTVVVDPAAALYPYGTVVRLTGVPQTGNYFGAWGNAAMSTDNPLLFPATNASPTVSCAFGPLNAGQVALTVLVNGRGRVTTNPRGNRFNNGQSVSLTAMADADQAFLGWSGDASGTSTNLTVVLAQSQVITAQFTKRPRVSLGPCLGGWRDDGFQLTLTGEFGGRYRIEKSSGLTNWNVLGTFTNVYGMWQVTDTAATNNATRFYRALEER